MAKKPAPKKPAKKAKKAAPRKPSKKAAKPAPAPVLEPTKRVRQPRERRLG